MPNPAFQFEALLEAIDYLSAEQKRIIRQRLDDEWSARFGDALASLHADIPAKNITDEELQQDIDTARV